MIAEGTITRLLSQLKDGKPEALDAIVPLIYDELRILAHRQRLRWRGDHTLDTTALVHETYLKLAGQGAVAAANRAHFLAVASRAMRHILCNYARDRRARKRGGGFQRVGLADAAVRPVTDPMLSDADSALLLALDAALARLEQVHPRRSRVVECRAIGGMSVVDTAAALDVSPRTVKRDWAAAQEWLRAEIASLQSVADEPGRILEKLAADVLPTALVQEDGDDFQPGQRIRHYEIVAPLGRGGMGVVYKAYDTRLDRHVALKFLSPRLSRDPVAHARLTYEARAASALDHPNICTIYDIDALADGRTFLALACYEGTTLREQMSGRPLPLADVVAITRQVAHALAAAHRRGIVHRDINPSNVMITTNGVVKVLDWGVAIMRDRHGGAHAAAGTVAYMSPEQTRGEEVDARSDLWSLGVVIHEMLTGRRPFAGQDRESLIDAIRSGPLPPLAAVCADVPPLLARLVETCLKKNRSARYRGAEQLLVDLDAIDAEAAAGRGAPSRRIAVLPLKSVTPTAEEEAYLAESVAEELAARLSKLSGLHVIARASTLSAAAAGKSLAEIGAALGVSTVVRGHVERLGEDIAIGLELVDVERDTPRWQGAQSAAPTNLESALRSLTWQLAGELAVQVYGEERRLLARSSSESGAAYALYLKGRYYLNKRDRESMQRARDHFQQALDQDPVFAGAWAGLADTFSLLGSYVLLQPAEAYPRARAAAEQALAIDGDLAEAHASLANVLADYDWNWPAAGRHYRRALTLSPGYATARLWYAGFLRDLGQFDAALSHVRSAREMDPLSLPIHAAEGTTLYVARRYDEGVAACRRLLEIDPSYSYAHFLMALPLVQQGAWEEAFRALAEAERRGSALAGVRSLTGYIHARQGRAAEARGMLEALAALASRPHELAFQRAVIHAALDERERALDFLEAACDARAKELRLLRIEPLFDSIRGEPRFQAVLARVGLTDDDVARALTP